MVCWGGVCEDMCYPPPSKRGCKHREEVCAECDCDPKTPNVKPKGFVWFNWCPGGCSDQIYPKHKLMKKTIVKTIPSYKWVVEEVCPSCSPKCFSAPVPAGVEVPPPPKTAARVIYTQGEPQ